MEELLLTKKQYNTFKFIRGWLMALFILTMIGAVGSAAGIVSLFAFAAYMPQDAQAMLSPQYLVTLFAFIPLVIALIMMGTLLFNKGADRKKSVSTAILVYAAMNAFFGVFNLAAGNPSAAMSTGYSLYGSFIPDYSAIASFMIVSYILTAISTAIYLFFAILLFRKARQTPNRIFPNKLLFILYIVLTFAMQYSILVLVNQFNIPVGGVIALGIIMGFFTFMSLFPFISLYKALDDEVFYKFFIVTHPSAAMNRYEQALYRPAAQPEAARYCVRCGKPLAPGAVYCRECGHKVGERIHTKED